jgi:hypothetical protein
MLESSKSYIRKIYVGNIGAYPRQTSIIVLQWVSSNNLTLASFVCADESNDLFYIEFGVQISLHLELLPKRFQSCS